jgi:predicted ATPase/DNA-binding SARP family transcriptional activator
MKARPESLAIHLLGHPRFTWNAEAYKFSAPRLTLSLLAFLLLNRDAHLTRDAVSFMIWPDESEESARTNLRRHLNYLKNALPSTDIPWFIADGESIIWNARSPAWVDVAAFESHVARTETLREAVECYAGDLLSGCYEDWIIVARDKLRTRYIGALEALLLEARSRRDLPAAIEYARRILRDDPWREDVLRHVMSVRYESGDRTGALHEFDDFNRRLHDDGGVEPMPETIVLRDRILRGAYLPEGCVFSNGEDHAAESGASSFPFVGHAAQLEQLTATWTRAARGSGSFVLIGGEAGTGKSRTASELALRATAQGGRVLRGVTAAPEQRPYQALASALQGVAPMLASLDVRPIWLRALSALLPGIESARADVQALPSLDPEREQTRLFEALSIVLNTFSKQRPTLLVLEDLHWAGASTLSAVEYLTRRAAMQSLLIVGTYRTDEAGAGSPLSAMRRRLTAQNAMSSVALGALSLADVRELVALVPAVAEEAREISQRIFAVSAGNALFVCELVRDRIESPDAQPAATANIRETIASRANRLSMGARLIADMASVIGLTFDVEFVGELAGCDEATVVDSLAELLDRRMIKEVGYGKFAFTFTHHLVQTTLYDAIDDRRRRRWHRRLADLVDKLPPAEKREALRSLAWHYEASGQPTKAADVYLDAAEHALSVFANDEALDIANAALALSGLATAQHVNLLLARERANSIRGDRAAQQADVDELVTLLPALNDPDAVCRVLRRRVRLARARSEPDLERRLVAELVTAAEACERPRYAEALQEHAESLRFANRFDEAYEAAHEAQNIYRSFGDETGAIECSCLLSEIACTQGVAAEMQRFIREARASSLSHQNKALIARATMSAAWGALMQHDYVTTRELSEHALELYREMGDREGEADALSGRGTALSGVTSRLDQSLRDHATAAAIYRELGKRSALGYLLFNMSATELQLGRLDDAQRTLAEAESIFETLKNRRGLTVCWSNLSMLLLLMGDAGEARRVAIKAVEGARELRSEAIEAATLSTLGNAERDLGTYGDAIDHMNEALAIRHRMGHPGTFEELADLALAYLDSGNVSAAVTTSRRTLERAEGSEDNSMWPHYCFWVAARVFRNAGDDAEASAALAQAHEILRDLVGSIDDERSRAAFLTLPMNEGIIAAVERGKWPTSGVR